MRALALLVTCLLFACGQGEPDDPFFLIGTVLNGSHQHVAEQPVRLLRGKRFGCGPFREGGDGWGQPDPNSEPALPFLDGESDENGQFLFELMRFQIAPRSELTYCFEVRTADPGGAASVLYAYLDPADFLADEFYLWREGVTAVTSVPEGHRLSSPPGPLPPTGVFEYSAPRLVAYEWDVTVGGAPIWRSERTEAPLLLDDRLREDFGEASAKVDLLANFSPEVYGPLGGSSYRAYSSGPPSVVPALPLRVPLSRGARCGGNDQLLESCPFTDGLLDLSILDDLGTSSEANGVPSLHFELAAPATPTSLIVRDSRGGMAPWWVEGSVDGTVWERLATVNFGPQWNNDPENQTMTMTAYDVHAAGYFLDVPLAPASQPVTRLRIVGPSSVVAREFSFF